MVYLILLIVGLWVAGKVVLRHEGRAPHRVLDPLFAPFGRIRTVPAGTELLSAKRYRFGPATLGRPAIVWLGWWNCRRFRAGGERYYFFRRESSFAIPAASIR